MLQTNNAYNQDYDKICQMEADIEVLQGKVTDYTRIEKGVNNDFDVAVRKMTELELEADSLIKLTWKKIWLKITRKYDDVYTRNMRAREAQQRELDNIKFRLSDVRGKLNDTKARLDRTGIEFKKLREYMKKTYTQFNEYEKKIEAENLRLRSIIKEIDEAVAVVNEVEAMVKLAHEKFSAARNWGIADMVFDDSLFFDIMKYNRINDAEGMVHAINAAVQRMNKELKDVNNVYGVYCQEFGSDLKFMDFVFDNIFLDWTVLGRIEENMSRLDSFIIKLEDVKQDLINNRKQVEKQIKK